MRSDSPTRGLSGSLRGRRTQIAAPGSHATNHRPRTAPFLIYGTGIRKPRKPTPISEYKLLIYGKPPVATSNWHPGRRFSPDTGTPVTVADCNPVSRFCGRPRRKIDDFRLVFPANTYFHGDPSPLPSLCSRCRLRLAGNSLGVGYGEPTLTNPLLPGRGMRYSATSKMGRTRGK